MEIRFDRERLSKWLADIASTADDEVDCGALAEMLETVVANGARGADIRAVLPQIAQHLDHCSDCRDWYDTLVELAQESE